MGNRVLFLSSRLTTLRVVTLVACLPVPLNAWLIASASRSEWVDEAGAFWWWLIPVGLVAVTLVMPAAMFLLHNRYVLRLERSADQLRLTTFLLWGRRTVELPISAFKTAHVRHDAGQAAYGRGPVVNAPSLQARLPDGRRLIFDAGGEAPEGWPAVYAIFGSG